jgi:hypothetical protein
VVSGRDAGRPSKNWPTGPSRGVKGSESLMGLIAMHCVGEGRGLREGGKRLSAPASLGPSRQAARGLRRKGAAAALSGQGREGQARAHMQARAGLMRRGAERRGSPPGDEDGCGDLREEVPGLGPGRACGRFVAGRGRECGIPTNQLTYGPSHARQRRAGVLDRMCS